MADAPKNAINEWLDTIELYFLSLLFIFDLFSIISCFPIILINTLQNGSNEANVGKKKEMGFSIKKD